MGRPGRPRKDVNSSVSGDNFLEESMKLAQQEYGEEFCYVAAEHAAKQLVIPIPVFSLRWLIESNGWPIGRFTQVGGLEGSFKSNFGFQLADWYIRNGGSAVIIDTESKMSSSMLGAMLPRECMDPENPSSKRVLVYRPRDIDAWQRFLSFQHKQLAAYKDKHKEPPELPCLWMIDSLMGVDTEDEVRRLSEEGETAGRSFSVSSLKISQFFKDMTGMLVGYNVTMHATNQEKPDMNSPGGHGMRRAGGKAPEFYATLDFRFKRGPFQTHLGKQGDYEPTASRPYAARTIRIFVKKNSMGPDKKELNVLFKFATVEDPTADNGTRIIAWWDWDSATTEILASKADVLEKKGVMDIHVAQKNSVGMVAWSDALGVKEDEALSATKFGKLVEANPELISKLDKVFGIHHHPIHTLAHEVEGKLTPHEEVVL